MEKKRILFNLATLLIIISSIWAYVFLQQRKQNAVLSQTETKILLSPQKNDAHDTVIIVVDKKKTIRELSPELELLNFVLRKGREGIPVLLLNSIF